MTTFRGLKSCACLNRWIPAFEKELRRRGLLKGNLPLYQLVGNAAASAGTHTGGSIDTIPLSNAALKVAREMGCAMWHRRASQGPWIAHSHGILRACPHNYGGRYQIAALAAGYNGLGAGGRGGRDDGPPPRKLRTWKAGIRWAKKQANAAAKKKGPKMKWVGNRYRGGAQAVGKPGKWRILDVDPRTKTGSRRISVSSGHKKWQKLTIRVRGRKMKPGDRISIQPYHVRYRKKGKNGPVNATLSLNLDAARKGNTTDTFVTDMYVPKGHRVRLRATGSRKGLKISNLKVTAVE